MSARVRWDGTVTAMSSIVHSSQTLGTTTPLRRETIIDVDGKPLEIPVVSGNAVRGRLRRLAEEMMRDVLHYEGELPLAAAHALRGGGSLAKVSGQPLTGERLHHVRQLVPHVAVFGCAAGGRVIGGCLQVGKLIPYAVETAHLTARSPGPDPGGLSIFSATRLETYRRHAEASTPAFVDSITVPGGFGYPTSVRRSHPSPDRRSSRSTNGATDRTTDTDDALLADELVDVAEVPLDGRGRIDLEHLTRSEDSLNQGLVGGGQLMFRIETFPAGTRFATWVQLDRATPLQVAFFTDVLAEFSARGSIGGRSAIGHGQITASWERSEWPPPPATPAPPARRGARTTATAAAAAQPEVMDWRAVLAEHRDDVLTAIRMLA